MRAKGQLIPNLRPLQPGSWSANHRRSGASQLGRAFVFAGDKDTQISADSATDAEFCWDVALECRCRTWPVTDGEDQSVEEDQLRAFEPV